MPSVNEMGNPGQHADWWGKPSTNNEQKKQDLANPDLALVRYYVGRQSLRGGDVRAMVELNLSRVAIPGSMDPEEWSWKIGISTRWRLLGEHINVLECRAYLLAPRWRFRDRVNVGKRFIHMVDSQVTLFACVKGRSSSSRLRRVLCKINAYVLAGHGLPLLGYVKTDWNPADKPSRFRKKTSRRGHRKLPTRLYPATASSSVADVGRAAKRQRQGQ